jgi:hypothetical protein
MAAPNIVNVTTITGRTAVQSIGTSVATLVENTAASGTVVKINSIIVSNIDGVNAADVTVELFRSSVAYRLASTITIPADSTLVVISKDNMIYLEEGDLIRCLASAAGDLQAICSYEIIS